MVISPPFKKRHLHELVAFSLNHWGEESTHRYLADLHAAAERLSKEHKSYGPRLDLSGSTGLPVYPVREHYIGYESLGKGRIAIAAIVRQEPDMPTILDRWGHQIRQALKHIREMAEHDKSVED